MGVTGDDEDVVVHGGVDLEPDDGLEIEVVRRLVVEAVVELDKERATGATRIRQPLNMSLAGFCITGCCEKPRPWRIEPALASNVLGYSSWGSP